VKALITADDFTSRLLLQSYGPVYIAVNDRKAVATVRLALKAAGVAGSNRTKTVMTTALADQEDVREAIWGKCDCFLTKPIHRTKLPEELTSWRSSPEAEAFQCAS
jgi:response regulator of citrate/malate metabolism